MNYFYNLPDELIDKIYFEVHKEKQQKLNKILNNELRFHTDKMLNDNLEIELKTHIYHINNKDGAAIGTCYENIRQFEDRFLGLKDVSSSFLCPYNPDFDMKFIMSYVL